MHWRCSLRYRCLYNHFSDSFARACYIYEMESGYVESKHWEVEVEVVVAQPINCLLKMTMKKNIERFIFSFYRRQNDHQSQVFQNQISFSSQINHFKHLIYDSYNLYIIKILYRKKRRLVCINVKFLNQFLLLKQKIIKTKPYYQFIYATTYY